MINWMKYKKVYFSISGILLLISFVSLFLWQVNPSIDFTGGALLEIRFNENSDNLTEISTEDLNSVISQVPDVQVNAIVVVDNGQSFVIKLNSIDENKKNEILAAVADNVSFPTEIRFETVGPTLGKELLFKTATAAILASLVIMMYVAYQFKDKMFGISAILAMFHDVIILVGAFSLFGHFLDVEIDMLFVTAMLTTLSFSVHDTIVVFDRIRERKNNTKGQKFDHIINDSITETLPRSLNNSLTIIMMLTALFLLGGVTIKWFAAALLVGTISGTYSSTFVAAPLLSVFYNFRQKRNQNKK